MSWYAVRVVVLSLVVTGPAARLSARQPGASVPAIVKGVVSLACAAATAQLPAKTEEPGENAGPASRLSEAARKLVVDLELSRPVKIEAFVSPTVPADYLETQRNLTALLGELEKLAGDKVQVRINHTERFSGEALRADERFGITPRAVTSATRRGTRTDDLFMGVALTCGLRSVVVPFVDRGTSAEYELVRSLCTFSSRDRKKVGVLATDVPLFGRFDTQTLSATPTWPIIDELERHYEVVRVDPVDPIAKKYDVLLAVQPSSLGPEEMDHFVEAVRGGQPTVIFEDPFPMLARDVLATIAPRLPPGGMMMGRRPPQPKGDISGLWLLLGVDFASDQVAWQDYDPYPDMRELPKEFVFVDTGSGAKQPFDADDPISAGLQHVLFPFPGFITKLHVPGLEFRALVRTGDVTGAVRYDQIVLPTQFGSTGGLNPDRRLIPTGVSYTLAARVRGKARTGDAPGPAELDVVLVADIDMLHETFFRIREMGDVPGARTPLDFDNVTFILNALDVLAGDDRFLAIRRRRGKHPVLARTPKQIEAAPKAAELRRRIQREYDEAVERERQAFAEEIEKLEERLRRENLPDDEVLARLDLATTVNRRRLDAKIEQLERKRDRETSRIGREPAPARPLDGVQPEDVRGERLFPEFKGPLATAGLEIVAYDEQSATVRRFKVAHVDGQWSILSHGNYPTDARDQVVGALTDLFGLTIRETASESRSDHELYGVLDPASDAVSAGGSGAGTSVTIRDVHDNVLMALVIGRELADRPGLRYVRIVGQIPVYTVKLRADNLSTRFADWIDHDLLRLEPGDIRRIQIHDYAIDALAGRLAQRANMTFQHGDQDGPKWRLIEDNVFQDGRWVPRAAAGEAANASNKLEDLKNAIVDLKIVDVRRKPAGLAATFKAIGAFDVDNEGTVSLAAHGFYVAQVDEKRKLLSRDGEIRLLMRDDVQYVLRFGQIATDTAAGPGLNRYLIVTAEFDADAIPKPALEPLPEEGESGDASRLQAQRQRIEKENKRKQEEYEERVAAGKARSTAMNARFADWYYLIADEAFRKIHRGRRGIVEDLP